MDFEVRIYPDVRGEWRWRLVASNGRVVADSAEGYVERAACRDMAVRIFAGAVYVELKADPVEEAPF